jgi:two-component system sensor histidine kinase/response regulator
VLLVPLKQTVLPVHWEFLGVAGPITKPIRQGEFGACLASVLGLHPVPGTAAGNTKSPTTDQLARRAQQRLLDVEDNPVNQQVLMGFLEHLGYCAGFVSDGASALQALRETAYTLVLTDCEMPEMDGYELSRQIRNPSSKVINCRIPIIAVTAHGLFGDREKCLAAGMNDYLTKPVRLETLEEVLGRQINNCGLPTPGTACDEAQTGPSAPLDDLQFDSADLVERLMGNEALAKRIAGTFIESMPGQLAALANAIQGSDLRAAMLAVHTIKGAAANLGAVSMRNFASKMESLGNGGALASASEILPELAATFDSLKTVLERFRDAND